MMLPVPTRAAAETVNARKEEMPLRPPSSPGGSVSTRNISGMPRSWMPLVRMVRYRPTPMRMAKTTYQMVSPTVWTSSVSASMENSGIYGRSRATGLVQPSEGPGGKSVC